jgi:flagellar FliJ protein
VAKRFRFKLEIVRRMRRREEERQQRVVAEALTEARRQRRELDALHEELQRQCRDKGGVQDAGDLDVAGLIRIQRYLGGLRQAIQDAGRRLAETGQRLGKEQARLAELTARRKVLDKLRDRRLAEHRRSVLREEQLETDEVGGQRYLRDARETVGRGLPECDHPKQAVQTGA